MVGCGRRWFGREGLAEGHPSDSNPRSGISVMQTATVLAPGSEPDNHPLGEPGPWTPTLTLSFLLLRERATFGTDVSGAL